MQLKIINLGRNKVNKTAEVDTSRGLVNDSLEDTLAGVASHYLMSRNIDVEQTENPKVYNVYAGFHNVGQIEVVTQ